MKTDRILKLVLIVAVILLIPFISMHFSDNINWTRADFVVAFGLLFGTGLMIELVIQKVRNKDYRTIIILSILGLLILTWAELSVGIFGTPFAGS